MKLKNTVTSLTQTAVSTAVNAARHPIGTTTQAVGLVKVTAGAGLDLVRNRIGGAPEQPSAPEQESAPTQSRVDDLVADVKETAVEATEKAADTVESVTEKAADTATVVTQKTAEKTAQRAETVKAKTSDKADEVKEAAPEAVDEVVAKVEQAAPVESPVESAGAKAPAAKKAPAKKSSAKAPEKATAKKSPAQKAPAKKAPAQKAPVEDPRDEIPGPDLAPYLPPAPEDLPEPIEVVRDVVLCGHDFSRPHLPGPHPRVPDERPRLRAAHRAARGRGVRRGTRG
jgi:hypothetical protein